MSLLITGARGLLGSAVTAEARRRGQDVLPLSRDELDITDSGAVHAAIRDARPGAVINCAAFSNVDRAEEDTDEAMAINRDGPRNLAEAAAESGSLLVHLSTDYVFDGKKTEPYLPSDQPAPLNLYGISKLAGEAAVRDSGCRHLIVRTSWLFGPGRDDFVDLVRKALTEDEDEPLRMVDDQVSRPTWTGTLAPALLDLVEAGARGVLHVANRGTCSRLELALEIREILNSSRPIGPLPSEEYGAPARRPAYSAMDLSGAEAALGRELPHWRTTLRTFLLEGEGGAA